MSHALDMIALAAAQARDELADVDAKCIDVASRHADLTRQRDELITLIADLEQAEVTLTLVGQGPVGTRRCRVCGCDDDNACPGPCSWRPDDGHGPCCTACDPNELFSPANIPTPEDLP